MLPGNNYIDLTLGASDATYTAPANGWLILNKAATGIGQEIRLTNYSNFLRLSNSFTSQPLPVL